MINILYRWKIETGKEDQFIDAWAEITCTLLNSNSSLGSRLHRGNDGIFYGYAQWNSVEERRLAFESFELDKARDLMLDAIEESFPEVILEPLKDFLVINS